MLAYATREYVQTLEHIGTPVHLKHSGCYLLKRSIPNTPYYDLIAPYPMFYCPKPEKLQSDIEEISHQNYISLTAIIPPFNKFNENQLKEIFIDKLSAYKNHYYIDLQIEDFQKNISRTHKKITQKSIRENHVSREKNPELIANEWRDLYTTLRTERGFHKSQADYQLEHLATQLKLKNSLVWTSRHNGKINAIQIWVHDNRHVYGHLQAANQDGYYRGALYATTWKALMAFKTMGFLTANLGGAPDQENATGIAKHKLGWTKKTTPAYIAGLVLDREKYREITTQESKFFPEYRGIS